MWFWWLNIEVWYQYDIDFVHFLEFFNIFGIFPCVLWTKKQLFCAKNVGYDCIPYVSSLYQCPMSTLMFCYSLHVPFIDSSDATAMEMFWCRFLCGGKVIMIVPHNSGAVHWMFPLSKALQARKRACQWYTIDWICSTALGNPSGDVNLASVTS